MNECFYDGECFNDYAHLYKSGQLCYNCKEENKFKIKGQNSCISIHRDELDNKGYLLINEKYNYYEKCSYNWYVDDIGENHCTMNDNCEDIPNRSILEETNHQCVKSCMTDPLSFCNECQINALYLYKDKCISQCPPYTKKNNHLHICELN